MVLEHCATTCAMDHKIHGLHGITTLSHKINHSLEIAKKVKYNCAFHLFCVTFETILKNIHNVHPCFFFQFSLEKCKNVAG